MRKSATSQSRISRELRDYFATFRHKTTAVYHLKVEEEVEEETEPKPRLLQLLTPSSGRIPLLSIPDCQNKCSLLTVLEVDDVGTETSNAKESDLESQSSTRDLGPIENSPYLDSIGQPPNDCQRADIVQNEDLKRHESGKHATEPPTRLPRPKESKRMIRKRKAAKVVLPVVQAKKSTPFEESTWVTQSLEHRLKSIRSMVYYHYQ
jgi:hypothetical protein